MSLGRISLKVGAPEAPLGAAKKVFCACDLKLARVSVPEEVTGEPVTLNKPVESARPTDVTVPPGPVFAIVRVEPEGVIEIPVPAAKVSAPVRVFKLVTPPEPELVPGYRTYNEAIIPP